MRPVPDMQRELTRLSCHARPILTFVVHTREDRFHENCRHYFGFYIKRVNDIIMMPIETRTALARAD